METTALLVLRVLWRGEIYSWAMYRGRARCFQRLANTVTSMLARNVWFAIFTEAEWEQLRTNGWYTTA